MTLLIEVMWLASTHTLWDNGSIIMAFLVTCKHACARVCVCVGKDLLHIKASLHKMKKKDIILLIIMNMMLSPQLLLHYNALNSS